MMWIAAYLYLAGCAVSTVVAELAYDDDPRRRRAKGKYVAAILLWPIAMPALFISGLIAHVRKV